MNNSIKVFILVIAMVISIVVALNEYMLYSLRPEDFPNWANDSLFYVIVIMLWAIILPQLYHITIKLKSDSRLVLLLRTFVLSFMISILHQVLSNLVFYSILFIRGVATIDSELITSFYQLVISGLFIRTIEAVVITFLLYIIATNEERLKIFIVSYWPRFYKGIFDSGKSIEIIEVKDHGITTHLNTRDVIWFESAGNYVEINLNDRKYLLRQTIGGLYESLDSTMFLRIHRSLVVNLNFVEQVKYMKNGEYKFLLQGSVEFNSSRNFKSQIAEKVKLQSIPEH